MDFRKNQPTNQPVHDEISEELRKASELIAAGKYADALAVLDALASDYSTIPERKCQIAALSAQAQLMQGKFGAAANTYAAAWELGDQTNVAWFSAALGQVRAQLRNVDVDNAFAAAQDALRQAQDLFNQFGSLTSTVGATVAQSGSASVARAPIRPSVAAFRLGQQFWEEGEPENALWFFTKATEIEPQGACRARIVIANIALQNEAFQEAYDGARAALLMGHFHAKTLSAWPVLIAAAQKLGRAGIEPTLISGLAQATPSVRGRARLVIARTLRAYNDPAWVELAAAPPAEDRHSILRAEFVKMKVASATSSPDSIAVDLDQATAAFLATPNLGPKEWLAAAKSTLTNQLASDEQPQPAALIAQGVSRYGEQSRATIAHGLALACQKANRADLALEILRPIASSAATGRPASVWLLAQLEAEQGNLSLAISKFAILSSRQDIAQRFRMLATLEWARLVVQSGDNQSLASAGPQLVAASQSIQDYELLLDLARQMTMAPGEIAQQASVVFNRGQDLANQAFGVQQDPQGALEILFKLARRQSDFGAYAAITQAWEQLSETKRDWLWCRSGIYWQYLALVAAAYRITNRQPAADALSEKYLEDTATPANGLAEIGIPHALSLLARGDMASAFDWFDWIIWQAPTHVLSAYAYYWLALRADKSGDLNDVQNRVQALHLSLGSSFGLAWMKELDARAQLLAGNAPADIAAQSEYSEDYLRQQAEAIQQDKARL
jgi:hypothetical protein